MNSLSILDQIVSVEEVARNYRAVFDRVKKSKRPLIVLRRNSPDIVLVDIDWLKEIEVRLKKLEEERLLAIVKEGRQDFKTGKAKILKSITSLMKS